jgi:hypothetical protein
MWPGDQEVRLAKSVDEVPPGFRPIDDQATALQFEPFIGVELCHERRHEVRDLTRVSSRYLEALVSPAKQPTEEVTRVISVCQKDLREQ